jgi:hypothetical protein
MYGGLHRCIQTYHPLLISLVSAICFCKAILEEELVEGGAHYGEYHAYRFRPSSGRSYF